MNSRAILSVGTGVCLTLASFWVQAANPAAVVDNGQAAIAKAMAALGSAKERAEKDSTRPIYHLVPPANWLNDPNGPLYYKGTYHLFYQHNPYADKWDSMHWGHWRSKDLVRWEQQPIALWPSIALGEDHCFSGCATLDGAGKPIIFYTSIGKREPQCWIARPEDEELVTWKKSACNPVLSESSHGVKYYEFRDPFIFNHQNHTYLLHGGNLNQSKGGQGCVSLFEAENSELTKWKFKSILFVDKESANIECPNFFELDGKFVLITSPHRKCDYFLGSFDPQTGKFTAETRGVVDQGDFYAPNTLINRSGPKTMWGWVTGYQPGRGWTGCMTLPRVLSVRDGRLIQQPACELAKLRGKHELAKQIMLDDGARMISARAGDAIEVAVEFLPQSAKTFGVRLCRSDDGQRAVNVEYDGKHLDVAGIRVPVEVAAGKPLSLRLFLDKSVLEVYANDGAVCVTRVVRPTAGDLGLEVFARGGKAAVPSIEFWEMKSIW